MGIEILFNYEVCNNGCSIPKTDFVLAEWYDYDMKCIVSPTTFLF